MSCGILYVADFVIKRSIKCKCACYLFGFYVFVSVSNGCVEYF